MKTFDGWPDEFLNYVCVKIFDTRKTGRKSLFEWRYGLSEALANRYSSSVSTRGRFLVHFWGGGNFGEISAENPPPKKKCWGK
jgi:hypothetical protein